MKSLVCVSKTPDTTAKIAFSADKTTFASDGVQFIMNPYDEWYALVRALELKEQVGGSVSVVNVGDASNDQIIRKALAIGADDAHRIDTAADSTYSVATQIAAFAKAGEYDVIFLGKETIDYNGSELGAMVAELLDLPFVSYASNMTVEGTTATIARDIEGGKETVEVNAPFVVSAAKGLAKQRIPNMRGIMMAKRKPLNIVPPVADEHIAQTVSFDLPEGKSACKYIDADNMDELVSLLHNEAKVL